jgi:hypothetical protein
VPAFPVGLSAAAVSTSQIDLTSANTYNGQIGFKIERQGGASATFTQIADLDSNTTSYSDIGLAASTTYTYRMRAYTSDNPSAYSSEVSATTNAPASISLTPLLLNASCAQGSNAASQSFEVWNSGGGTLSYTVGTNASWVSCSPTNGTSTGEHNTITVDYSTSKLSAGTYSATITITAAGASNTPQRIPVNLTVSASPSNGRGGGCFIDSAAHGW